MYTSIETLSDVTEYWRNCCKDCDGFWSVWEKQMSMFRKPSKEKDSEK